MCELEMTLRDKLITDMKQNGIFYEEVQSYLINTGLYTYLNLIKSTIDAVIKKAEAEDEDEDDYSVAKCQRIRVLECFKSLIELARIED
jgi:hypothetical protein